MPARSNGITKAERNRRSAEAKAVTSAAYRNPLTRCCSCGRTLDQCGPRGDGRNANGTPCRWDAGHPDGRWPGVALRAECSACNRRRGAADGNRRREPHTPWA
jgi:hypothetical protein